MTPRDPTITRAHSVDWTPAEYHQSHRASASRLRDFRRSRRAYHDRHVTRTLPGITTTPAMVLGSLVDDMLLLPDADRWIVAPECDGRTKEGKAIMADFRATVGDRYVVTADQHATATAILESLHASPSAGPILAMPGASQRAILWDDGITGLPCRALPDLVIPGLRLCVDLKTTTDASPEAFGRKIASYEYHAQAAWYLRALELLTGEEHTFAFVVAATVAPYEVAVYELALSAILDGAAKNATALCGIAACMESGEWLSDWERTPQAIDLPRWAYSRGEGQ